MKTFNVLVLLAVITLASCNPGNNPFLGLIEKFEPKVKQGLSNYLRIGKEFYKTHHDEIDNFIKNNRDGVAEFIEDRRADLDVLIDELVTIIKNLKTQKTTLLETYVAKLKEISAQQLVDKVYEEVSKAKDF